ncbi:MAG: metallophosphoesterase [Aquificae bacterium]|nr:metallophosphoesterase [Aquificota bacterium]
MDNFLKIDTQKLYAVIGDVHGCYYEFKQMLSNVWDKYGKDTLIISVGDNIDRGDYNLKTLDLCIDLYEKGKFIEVQSNHMDKFVRWLKGNKVKISYGMQKTVNEFLTLSKNTQERYRKKIIDYYQKVPLYLIINKDTVVAHAGIKDEMIGKTGKKVKSFVLYGETTGKFTPTGLPERLDWTKKRKVTPDSPKIVYGHVVFEEPYINNKCYGIDTGCVFGNKLTAYLPDLETFEFVKAKKIYYTLNTIP